MPPWWGAWAAADGPRRAQRPGLSAEKGGTQRWQPVTLDLATALAGHAQQRGAVLPTDALLRFGHGGAMTSRRYDRLWQRLGQQLPWIASQGVSTHWLRHTTLTWVERHFGYGVARAYAGHRQQGSGDHHQHQSRPAGRRYRPGRHDRPAAPAGRLSPPVGRPSSRKPRAAVNGGGNVDTSAPARALKRLRSWSPVTIGAVSTGGCNAY